MTVEAIKQADVLHIKIAGRFDFGAHKQFREVTDLITAEINKIEVDLSAADYLDSSALGMLLLLRDKVAGGQNRVELKGARADVKRILEIANFHKLFIVS